jgi:Mrp family chromosome partitioning ATPase
MAGGRAKVPVLAEISGPAPSEARVFSLRRADVEALAPPLERLTERRVVMVSGEGALAGVLAVALAGAAAAAGRRTVLLECELARPQLAGELGLAEQPGLHEYLRWEATAPEILQPLVLGGSAARRADAPLVCVAGGRPASDQATLLGLASFRHAVKKLRSAYEFVVLSGPALGAERAALDSAAAQAEAVLLGVSSGQVSGRAGRALRAAAGRLPLPPLGAVVVGEG